MKECAPGSLYCEEHRDEARYPKKTKMAPHDKSRLLNKTGEPLGPIENYMNYTPQTEIAKDLAHEGGVKSDQGKAPVYRGLFRYFPRALKAVSNVSGFGAQKYTWENKKVPGVPNYLTIDEPWERYSDALGRHILDELIEGEVNHKDGDLQFAAQVAWNALARLEWMLRQKELTTLGDTKNAPQIR